MNIQANQIERIKELGYTEAEARFIYIVAHGGVPMLQEFLGKGIRALTALGLCEIEELPQREVA